MDREGGGDELEPDISRLLNQSSPWRTSATLPAGDEPRRSGTPGRRACFLPIFILAKGLDGKMLDPSGVVDGAP